MISKLLPRNKFLLTLLNGIFLFYALVADAQTQTVTGVVRSNADNQPLQGVTVQVKGTTNTTATDAKGAFTLRNISSADSISFSSIGFQNQTFAVNNRSSLNINLQTEASALEQVVVVGYGTRRRSDVTGAIAQVSGDAFKFQSTTQLTEMLAGTVAGFNSNQGTSARGGGSMEIRGR
ncbi:MAG: carboxypeptidase-like regulatory domain-containing protein, partial [Segetibacter sp.]|nr:carboxypeptidase-like regulatory domain-containing protein [Segetibacter sp.]